MSAISLYIESNKGGRQENQDNYSSQQKDDGWLILVCDGMGGTAGGRLAAEMACDIVMDQFMAAVNDPVEAITSAIKNANQDIYAKGRTAKELQQMGTTLAALYLGKGSATFFHLGDTRIYHLRKGRIENRTADHSRVGEMVRRGILSDEQARLSADSNIISKALGIEPDVTVEITRNIDYQKGDRFVLCTDGIWGVLPEDQLLKTLSQERRVQEIVASLIQDINTTQLAVGGEHDNMTLALVEVIQDGNRSRRGVAFSKQSLLNIFLAIMLIVSLIFLFSRSTNEIDKPDKPLPDSPVHKTVSKIPAPNDTIAANVQTPVFPAGYIITTAQWEHIRALIKKMQTAAQKDSTGKMKLLVDELNKAFNILTKQ